MSDWFPGGAEWDECEPDISLCENCWCMTHTLVGNICGKCKKPKHITKEDEE